MSVLNTNLPAALLLALVTWPCLPSAQEAGETDAPAAVMTMEEVEKAWAAKDFIAVRQGLQRLAEVDQQPFAMYRYARVLIQGRGGPKELRSGVVWLEKAIEGGQLDASVLLARLLLSQGTGGPAPDPERAARLLKSAAPRGNVEAQYYLALLYREGVGVAQSAEDSLNWMLAAAEGGKIDAQFEMSRMASKTDPAKAVHWLQEAATSGHAEAQFFLGFALDQGRGLARNTEAGFDWLHRSAEGGYVPAQVVVGRKYLKGEGTTQNGAEAERWLQLAARAGSAEAMTELAAGHLAGTVLKSDPPLALALYKQAEQYGSPNAMVGLAAMLEEGQGGAAVDIEAAVALYREALGEGHTGAAVRLGDLAGQGKLDGLLAPHRAVPWAMAAAQNGNTDALEWVRGHAQAGIRPAQSAIGIWNITQNGPLEEAVTFLTAAAEAGDPPAQHQLGLLFISGQGVEQDYVQAHKWLNIAAASGSSAAADKRAVVVDLMTAEQVAKAQTAARAFFEQVKSPAGVSE